MGSLRVPTPAGFTSIATVIDGVGEGVLGHIHLGLVLGFDPVAGTGLGELELELGLGHY